jgi:large subunit ribosomal protein L29
MASKAAELRGLSADQLTASLNETRKELFKLRFQAATEKLDSPSKLRKLRREISRMLTVLHERAEQPVA